MPGWEPRSKCEGEAAGALVLAEQAPTATETLLSIIPRNPVQAAAEMDLLPLIFFTIIFAAAISVIAPAKRDAVITFFEGVNDASMIVIDWVMKLAPYAVFALIAAVVARFGTDLLQSLLVYAATVVVGLVLHLAITYGFAVRFLAKMNFRHFLTINMDGTALYQAVAVMFIAQIYGIELSMAQQLMVVLTATLASVGAAGVPSAGRITLIIVLNAVGLGAHVQAGMALILGVDRPLDMLRTSVNVTGDLTAASVVARSEGEELAF